MNASTGNNTTNNGAESTPYATIGRAITAATDGDTVLVAAGTYVENINFNSKSLVVNGENRETTIIDGNQAGTVVTLATGDYTAVLSGFTITNGHSLGYWGGGINLGEISSTLTDLIVSGNTGSGAGIYISGSNYKEQNLTNIIIRDNTGYYAGSSGGGMMIWGGSPTITNVIISNNSAGYGGGLMVNGNPTITNVLISDNTAGYDGGGIALSFGNPILNNVTITGNTAEYSGGAVKLTQNSNPVFINSILWNNSLQWNDSQQEIFFDGSLDPSTVTILSLIHI